MLRATSKVVPTQEQQQLLDVLPSWWYSSPTTSFSPPTPQNMADMLYKDLFASGYSTDVGPFHDCGVEAQCSDPLPVMVGLKLVKIIELDEKSSVLSVQVVLSLMWPDERLDYDPAMHVILGPWDHEEDAIPVETSKIWMPDVQLTNAAAPTEPIFMIDAPKAFIYSAEKRRREGFNVRTRQQAVMHVKCELDLDSFPFDNQSCKFIFRPWTSNAKRMNLLPANSDQFEPSKLSRKNEEFSVLKISDKATRFEQDELGDGLESFAQVEYTLDLQRHVHFYLARIVLPMLMVVVLSAGLFYMQLSDARIVVGVTLVLVVMSVSSFTASLLPKGGGADTWLERFQSDCYVAVMTPLFASLFLILLQRILVEEHNLEHVQSTRCACVLVAADKCLRLLFVIYVLWLTCRILLTPAVWQSREPSVFWVQLYLMIVIMLMVVLALLDVSLWARDRRNHRGGTKAQTDARKSVGGQEGLKPRSLGEPTVATRRTTLETEAEALAEEARLEMEAALEAAEVSNGSEEASQDEADDSDAKPHDPASSRASLPVQTGHVSRLREGYGNPR